MNEIQQTVLVTGANSGIGFETVKQLSLLGYAKIILACRTKEKGELTIRKLLNEGLDSAYSILTIDLSNKKSSHTALKELIASDSKIDLLVLNACVTPKTLEKNQEGIELTFASALLGHHILTMGLLTANLLSENARIVTSGSEAARGDVPMMALPKFDKILYKDFKGNHVAMLKSFMFLNTIKEYAAMKTYAIAKLYVSLWTSSLARKLPKGIIANSISPGATPDTNLARHQSWAIKNIMMPMMKIMGMTGTLTDASKRYLKILDFNEKTNGKFWVSKKGKMVGPIVVFSSSYIDNSVFQDAVWDLIDEAANI